MRSKTDVFFAAVFVAVTAQGCAGCGEDEAGAPPPTQGTVEVAADGVRVLVDLSPFRVRILRPGSDVAVLETFDGSRAVTGDDVGAFIGVGATKRMRELRAALLEGFDHTAAMDEKWFRPRAAEVVVA